MLINNKGFTLLEVMVSLVIIAVGLLGLSSLTVSMIQGNVFSDKLTTATILAQDKLEELENLAFTDAQLTGDAWTARNWDSSGDNMIDNNDNDGDGDGIPDFFDADKDGDNVVDANISFDHINSETPAPNNIINPIDIDNAGNIANVQLGGFWRIWNVWNNAPTQADTTRKTVVVMVSWIDGNRRIHTVKLSTEVSIS